MTVMATRDRFFVSDAFAVSRQRPFESEDSNEFLDATRKAFNKVASVQSLFNILANGIDQDCGFISSVHEIEEHPCYRLVVSMGEIVLPLILEQIKNEPDIWWFSALREITGKNPIKSQHEGVIEEMAHDWLEWAKREGCQW